MLDALLEPTSKYTSAKRLLGTMVLMKWIIPEQPKSKIILTNDVAAKGETFWRGKVLMVGVDCVRGIKEGDIIYMSYMQGAQDWWEGSEKDADNGYRLAREESIFGIY